jgi:hypothetical protein
MNRDELENGKSLMLGFLLRNKVEIIEKGIILEKVFKKSIKSNQDKFSELFEKVLFTLGLDRKFHHTLLDI